MSTHRAHFNFDAPAEQWLHAQPQIVQLEIPPAFVQKLAWLSQRWSVPFYDLVTEILTAEVCGRSLMMQLAIHGLQPSQLINAPSEQMHSVRLLMPVVASLNKQAVSKGLPLGTLASRVLQTHLVGEFNIQMVSINKPDPEGDDLNKDIVPIKIRLPEAEGQKIRILTDCYELTKSDVIRNFLLLGVYGRIRYEQWTAEGHWKPKSKATKVVAEDYQEGEIRFSRHRNVGLIQLDISRSVSRDDAGMAVPPGPESGRIAPRKAFIQEHGKNTNDIKVFLPTLLKDRLEHLARSRRRNLSEFCRDILMNAL